MCIRDRYKDYYNTPSVHLLKWPEVDRKYIDQELEEQIEIVREIYKASCSARMKAGLKLRQPVRRLIIYTDDERVRKAVAKLMEVIRFTSNAREVEVSAASKLADITRYNVKPVYKVLGPKYKGLLKKILEYIEQYGDVVAKEIIQSNKHTVNLDGMLVDLTRDDVEIIPYYVEGYLVEGMKYGVIALDTKLTSEEIADGLARDIVRRIQVMRKKLNLQLLLSLIHI